MGVVVRHLAKDPGGRKLISSACLPARGGRGGKLALHGSPGLGEGLVSSRCVSLLVGNDPPGTIPRGCAMTRLWSSPLSSKLPIRALRMMSSRPRLLAGSAKDGPLALTEPGRGRRRDGSRGKEGGRLLREASG